MRTEKEGDRKNQGNEPCLSTFCLEFSYTNSLNYCWHINIIRIIKHNGSQVRCGTASSSMACGCEYPAFSHRKHNPGPKSPLVNVSRWNLHKRTMRPLRSIVCGTTPSDHISCRVSVVWYVHGLRNFIYEAIHSRRMPR